MRSLLLFHKTIAEPVILYGLMKYGATANTNLDPIEKAQQRILRAIFLKNRRSYCSNQRDTIEKPNWSPETNSVGKFLNSDFFCGRRAGYARHKESCSFFHVSKIQVKKISRKFWLR